MTITQTHHHAELIRAILEDPQWVLEHTSSAKARRIIAGFASAFPDGRVTADWAVADEHRVVVGGRFTGTHLGPWRDVAPTGRVVSAATVVSLAIADGVVTDMNVVTDSLSVAEQLGAVVPLGAPACRRPESVAVDAR
jgi:predicted ester cyclase